MSLKEDFWHAYYEPHLIERSDRLRQNFCIDAGSVRLNMEAYLQPDPAAPVILLNHGEASYARLMIPVVLALYDRGYSVLALDQRGHGLSGGSADDFTLSQLAQDVLDASHWARRMVSGPLFLAGVNQGSGLVYSASGMGAPVVGMILHHLYDFSSPDKVLAASRFSRLARFPGGAQLAGGLARTLMTVSPGMRLSYDSLANFDDYLDARDNGHYETWLEDPSFSRTVSLRYAVSTFSTPPPVPFEHNAQPVLVINPTRDTVFDPAITRRRFDHLSGPKRYAEIDYGHWSLLEDFARDWSHTVDAWVRDTLAR
jgi:alpha-beta hydrolase superfamily lysophospholipase